MGNKKTKDVPNPGGREGRPLSVEEALRKMLAVKPEKLAELKKSV